MRYLFLFSRNNKYVFSPPCINIPSMHNKGCYMFRPLLRAIVREQNKMHKTMSKNAKKFLSFGFKFKFKFQYLTSFIRPKTAYIFMVLCIVFYCLLMAFRKNRNMLRPLLRNKVLVMPDGESTCCLLTATAKLNCVY